MRSLLFFHIQTHRSILFVAYCKAFYAEGLFFPADVRPSRYGKRLSGRLRKQR